MARVDLVAVGELLARGDVDGALRLADPVALADALAVRLPRTAELVDAGCVLLAHGIAAGIGVASGRLVLTAGDALRDATDLAPESVVLVQRETSAEDVAGVRVARALVEAAGGLTSEGAVMARGLGLPCVVGATSLRVDAREGRLFAVDAEGVGAPREVRAGARVTVCGTTGRIVLGEAVGAPGADEPVLVALLVAADARRQVRVVALARTTREEEAARLCGADATVTEGEAMQRPREIVAAIESGARELLVVPSRTALARLAAARQAAAAG